MALLQVTIIFMAMHPFSFSTPGSNSLARLLDFCMSGKLTCLRKTLLYQKNTLSARRSAKTASPPISSSPGSLPEDDAHLPASGKRSSSPASQTNTYTATLNLPRTAFQSSIKPGEKRLQHERRIQDYAQFDQLYMLQRQRFVFDAAEDNQSLLKQPDELVLHDGPPYANGPCHMGHAVNKITKDIYNRHAVLSGRNLHYVPGWDCHGLPIELMAANRMRMVANMQLFAGDTFSSDIQQVRVESYKFACESLTRQRDAFRSWAVLADWTQQMPLNQGGGTYVTMTASYEAMLLDVFYRLYERGLVTRSSMPVYWSPSSRTALAEAELEYNEQHISTAVVVKLDLTRVPSELQCHTANSAKSKVSLLIWTTTPWSLVANQAVCYSESMQYVLVKDPTGHANSFFIIAKSCLDFVVKECTWNSDVIVVTEFAGAALADAAYAHPIMPSSQTRHLPLLPGTHVTEGKGTGLVHCAPNHGHEDYLVFMARNLTLAPMLVDENGRFAHDDNTQQPQQQLFLPPNFIGKSALGDDGTYAVLDHLRACGSLIAVDSKFKHSYPYDWRTKKPVLIRASPQWFFNTRQVSARAVDVLERDVHVIPERLKLQLAAMLLQRPYWCISRQRKWGTPIPVFYADRRHPVPNEPDGRLDEVVCTRQSVDHLRQLFLANGPDTHNGSDVWWDTSKSVDDLLPANVRQRYGGSTLRRGDDILDIWFESGSSWHYALPVDENGKQIADCVVEGYDQIGAWFQTSLLLSVALQDCAPYRTVFVHGFVQDEAGRKMSKSLGNVVDPNEVIAAHGADVLRLIVARHVEPGINMALSRGLIESGEEVVRKWRHTMRYVLGSLDAGFCISRDAVPYSDMLFVDRYMLQKLRQFSASCEQQYNAFAAHRLVARLLPFMTTTLSSFYFSVIKDRMYCDARDSLERRSAQTVLWHLLWNLNALVAPILPHLAEECFATYLDEHSEAERDDQIACMGDFPRWDGKKPFLVQPWHVGGGWRRLLDAVPIADEARMENGMQLITTLRDAINRLRTNDANRQNNPLHYAITIAVPDAMRADEADLLFTLNDSNCTAKSSRNAKDGRELGCDQLADLLQVSQCFVHKELTAEPPGLMSMRNKGCSDHIGLYDFSISVPAKNSDDRMMELHAMLRVLASDEVQCRCARCRKMNVSNVSSTISRSNSDDDSIRRNSSAESLCNRCLRVLAL